MGTDFPVWWFFSSQKSVKISWNCLKFNIRLHFWQWTINLFQFRPFDTSRLTPGRRVLPYKSDGDARPKISRTPVKGTRIFFYGRVQNSFPPLRGTNTPQQIIWLALQILIVIKITFDHTLFSRTFWKYRHKSYRGNSGSSHFGF